jgi:hypothetical protein
MRIHDLAWLAWPGLVQQSVHTPAAKPFTPLAHSLNVDLHLSRYGKTAVPLSQSQNDPRTQSQRLRRCWSAHPLIKHLPLLRSDYKHRSLRSVHHGSPPAMLDGLHLNPNVNN